MVYYQEALPEGEGNGLANGGRPELFALYLAEIRPEIDARIERFLSSLHPGDLSDDTMVLLRGGKRLRAGMTMLLFDALADQPRSAAIDLAAAIEIAHATSLILDDILDEDGERRGRPTLHLSLGLKRTILEVTGVLSFPYALISRYGGWYVEEMARTHYRMVQGVLGEIEGEPAIPLPERYDRVIASKTGELFGLAAGYGAAIAGSPSSIVRSAARYGRSVGKAMQVADDIADLSRSGKPSGSEALLLQCVAGDRNGTGDRKDRLMSRLTQEVDRAVEEISALDLDDLRSSEAVDRFCNRLPWLIAAPRDIARMMLEGQG